MAQPKQLVRVGRKVPFLELNIGNPFWAHDEVWIRTSYSGATQLKPSGKRGSSCNFTIDGSDRIVEAIEYTEAIEDFEEPINIPQLLAGFTLILALFFLFFWVL